MNMSHKVDKRVIMTAEEILKETRLVLEKYPADKKLRDPLDGRRMLTKDEALKRFDGDNKWAVKVAAKIYGLKLDVLMRKVKSDG